MMVAQFKFSSLVIGINDTAIKKWLVLPIVVLAISACSQQNPTQSTSVNTPSSSPIAASVSVANPPALSVITADEPLTQLVATTLNNGFLLAVNQQPTLTPKQKQCLSDFDPQQSVTLAQNLLQTHLTPTDVNVANEFYQLPVGQKVLKFNQQYFSSLKQQHPNAGKLDVTDDEKLQIAAFIETSTGQKIQQLATTQLQNTFAPIETVQLQKCGVSSQQFNAVPLSTEPTASTAQASPNP